MSLCTIQLVEPFADSLARAAIFITVLNLIFIVLFLQTCFLLLDTFLQYLLKKTCHLSVSKYFFSGSLFVLNNYCRCFFHKARQDW